jgi:hypothetical protein
VCASEADDDDEAIERIFYTFNNDVPHCSNNMGKMKETKENESYCCEKIEKHVKGWQ